MYIWAFDKYIIYIQEVLKSIHKRDLTDKICTYYPTNKQNMKGVEKR